MLDEVIGGLNNAQEVVQELAQDVNHLLKSGIAEEQDSEVRNTEVHDTEPHYTETNEDHNENAKNEGVEKKEEEEVNIEVEDEQKVETKDDNERVIEESPETNVEGDNYHNELHNEEIKEEMREETKEEVNEKLRIIENKEVLEEELKTNIDKEEIKSEDKNNQHDLAEESNKQDLSEQVESENEEKDPDAIKYESRPRREKLYFLFLYYSEVQEEAGTSIMHLTSFLKLLTNSSIFDANLNKTTAEIIYKSVTKKKQMDFNVFISALLKLSEIKYNTADKVEAAGSLINKHLIPLYTSICAGNMNTIEVSPLSMAHKLVFEEEAKYLLNSVSGVLYSIYKLYIQEPLISAKTEEQALRLVTRQLFVCLRDFELLKNLLVSKASIVLMLNILITECNDSQSQSNATFTFNNFLMFLYWLSLIGFDMRNQEVMEYTGAEKVYCLLMRMQYSKGIFKKQPHCIQSLIPPNDVIKEVIKNSPWKDKEREEISPTKTNEEEKDKLEKVFILYCPINSNKMPLHKFISLLKDCDIITNDITKKSISVTDAELLFKKATKLTNELHKKPPFSPYKKLDARQDKLDFKAFSHVLTLIGMKVYPAEKQEQSFTELYENNISHLIPREESNMKALLRKEDIIEVLKFLKKALAPYIAYYKKNKGINYDSFMMFCKDFGVFPAIATKFFLRKVFYSLEEGNKEAIDEGEVIEALGICALKSIALARDTNPVFKILHLAEKLSRSSGVAKIKRKAGITRLGADDANFLKEMRMRYKSYFNKKQPELTQEDIISKVLMDTAQ